MTTTNAGVFGPINLPDELPISQRADELIEAIATHQVIVVAGETGSGKSTQLPKLCLAAGRGVNGLVGHTQPRRLAARAVAERVAQELGGSLGDLVGYQVRFTDTTAHTTRIKLMTDGILLNELQHDRRLSAYDTIIIDEAHERGLNIDFILGYLAQLLPRRPDLKVIVTSATIDTERFARHFAGPDGTPAPIIEVSGRTYHVDVRYRPSDDSDDEGNRAERDLTDAITDAVTELCHEGPGDILVFASGERDIRDAADALRHAIQHTPILRGTEVLPLFARLSAAEQHKVFAAHRQRRIVIATNIAETSLTVPGIRYVVDPGLARISRYGRKSKVQRLPIEKISQASANQRAGRCGRLGPGIAIRLYDEDDFGARPEFTEPEIKRTNLASVILQMTALGLGDVAAFPFVDRPDDRLVADGVRLLQELGALSDDRSAPGGRVLTDVGRQLARLPLDPRLARMVIEGAELGCATEVMIIAAALSIQDVRERPRDKAHTAAQYHARFAEPNSDFITLLHLWSYVNRTRRRLSGNQFRKRCRTEFLHHMRIREWQDVYSQIRRVVRDLGVPAPAPKDLLDVDEESVHRAMLAGLLDNVGMRDGDRREYRGTRDTRFVIGRQSVLSDTPPAWVMAAEMVETNRLWAHSVAAIRPDWIEPLAGDLVQRTYGDPVWNRQRGAATTVERVTFRGLPIVSGRRVNLSRVDAVRARRMFIQHALMDLDTDEHYGFQTANARVVQAMAEAENRLRRRASVAPEDILTEFYEQRLPPHIVSSRHFATWFAAQRQPDLLEISADRLVDSSAPDVLIDYPDSLPVAGTDLAVSYTFDPSRPDVDGLTVDIPIQMLPAVDPAAVDWLVPGLHHEVVVALIRALPKALRRGLVPAPQTATAVLQRIGPQHGPLLPVLAQELTRIGGVPITTQAWRGVVLPSHLRPFYRVTDGETVLASGDDLSALRAGVADHVRRTVAQTAPTPTRSKLTDWSIGDLPRSVTVQQGGLEVTSYPALVDEGSTVGVRNFATRVEQQQSMWPGTRRLLRLALPNPVKTLNDAIDQTTKLALTRAPHDDVAAVIEDCMGCVIDAIVAEQGGPAWHATGFTALRDQVRARSPRLLINTARAVAQIVTHADAVKQRLNQPAPAALDATRHDVARQLGRLVYPGFVTATGGRQLVHLPRYIHGMVVRLDAAGRNPGRDTEHLAVITDLEEEYRVTSRLQPQQRVGLAQIRWQLEELRIGLFAQSLGTAQKTSEGRVRAALARIRHPQLS